MAATGKFTPSASDDARYVLGHTYNIVLNADQSFNELAIREDPEEPEPVDEPVVAANTEAAFTAPPEPLGS